MHHLCVAWWEPRRKLSPFPGFPLKSPLAPHKERVEGAFPEDLGVGVEEGRLSYLSCPFFLCSPPLPEFPQKVQGSFSYTTSGELPVPVPTELSLHSYFNKAFLQLHSSCHLEMPCW